MAAIRSKTILASKAALCRRAVNAVSDAPWLLPLRPGLDEAAVDGQPVRGVL